MKPSIPARIANILVFVALASVTACGRPFKIETAPGLYELHHQEPRHDFRAMTPEGVVVSVRAIDTDGRGDLEFWTRTFARRMQQLNGYALLADAAVISRDGTSGRELRFGHDESGKPYTYSVRLFVAQSRLFVVELGGPADEVARYRPSLDWMVGTLKVRCDTPVSPVLASRTCNRW